MTSPPSSRRGVVIASAAFVVLTFAFAIPEYVLRRYTGQAAPWSRVLLGVAPHFLLWGAFAFAVSLAVRRFPIERPSLVRRGALYFVLGLSLYALDGAISFAILPRIIHDQVVTSDVMRALFIRTFFDDFLLYWVIVAALHLVQYERRLVAEAHGRAAIEEAFAAARLSALKSQLQPHFLFNTLNAIAELLHSDKGAAERMLERLAVLLRSTLDLGDRREIRLSEELAMLDEYLAIQRVRFGDTIEVVRDVDADTGDCAVPPLLLQPLVENAFQHGFGRQRRDARLEIRAGRAGERMRLQVLDNGTGLAADAEERVGLGNSRRRLEALYGDAQSLRVEPREPRGVAVEVEIPFRRMD